MENRSLANHFVVVIDGKVMDQHGIDEMERLARRRVRRTYFIEETP
jgi:hypothetical protein